MVEPPPPPHTHTRLWFSWTNWNNFRKAHHADHLIDLEAITKKTQGIPCQEKDFGIDQENRRLVYLFVTVLSHVSRDLAQKVVQFRKRYTRLRDPQWESKPLRWIQCFCSCTSRTQALCEITRIRRTYTHAFFLAKIYKNEQKKKIETRQSTTTIQPRQQANRHWKRILGKWKIIGRPDEGIVRVNRLKWIRMLAGGHRDKNPWVASATDSSSDRGIWWRCTMKVRAFQIPKCTKIWKLTGIFSHFLSCAWSSRRLLNRFRLLKHFWATETVSNKSPAGVEEAKHVNGTFLVKMNFKFGSFWSFWIYLGRGLGRVKGQSWGTNFCQQRFRSALCTGELKRYI